MGEYFKRKVPIAEIERLAGLGLNWKQVSDAIGMSEDTLKRRRDNDPEIEESFNRGRASTIAAVANAVVVRALEGCPQSQKLYMNSIGGWAKNINTNLELSTAPSIRIILTQTAETLALPETTQAA